MYIYISYIQIYVYTIISYINWKNHMNVYVMYLRHRFHTSKKNIIIYIYTYHIIIYKKTCWFSWDMETCQAKSYQGNIWEAGSQHLRSQPTAKYLSTKHSTTLSTHDDWRPFKVRFQPKVSNLTYSKIIRSNKQTWDSEITIFHTFSEFSGHQ